MPRLSSTTHLHNSDLRISKLRLREVIVHLKEVATTNLQRGVTMNLIRVVIRLHHQARATTHRLQVEVIRHLLRVATTDHRADLHLRTV